MFKRPLYIFIGLAVMTGLVILVLQSSLGSRLKVAVSSLFLPLFGLSSTVEAGAETAGERIAPRSVLIREIDQLKNENERLRLMGLQATNVFHENNRIRAQIQWSERIPWKMRLARVIGRDPSNWWRMIHIDLGSRHGLTNNLAVITSDGLVGRVGEVGISQSQVILVGDPNCRVSVMIRESGEQGIIAPTSINPLDPAIVEMGYISRNSVLTPDQQIVTSGLGGVFPAGIPVGRLLDYRMADSDLYHEARLKLDVSSSSLREVWVIMP